MKGIISEGSGWIGEDATDAVMDAGLIMEAQHAEHYEMAGYGSARAYAEALGHTEAVTLLQQSLDEEIGADTKLNTLASRINFAAQNQPVKRLITSRSSGTTARSRLHAANGRFCCSRTYRAPRQRFAKLAGAQTVGARHDLTLPRMMAGRRLTKRRWRRGCTGRAPPLCGR